ncbi:BLUF domain-containing protein [Rhodopseudomonas palustris]|uniref:BLUF domain-containing protein n=1 Tax=Rhodopseudomonas palustris TaxID=1076 RepID=UPI002ACDC369|nr:BLUF domain-containing protein [Rhodopseudomonas palustris]WQG98532.1 BLUF domain-containing protein [Rhodopseudomonas palustris]
MPDRHYRCVYWSRQRTEGGPGQAAAEVESILAAARHNNPRLGITGALAIGRGVFAQLLEGPRHAVEMVFEKIQRDERHGDVQVLAFGPVAERAFPHWPMARLDCSNEDSVRLVAFDDDDARTSHPEARRLLDIVRSLATE